MTTGTGLHLYTTTSEKSKLFLLVYIKSSLEGSASVNASTFWANFADFLAAFAIKRVHSTLGL